VVVLGGLGVVFTDFFWGVCGVRGIKCLTASLGGVTLWAVANDNDKILNVGWWVVQLC
jgi:hypothetical protein